jgi:hypothetical protein
VLVEEILGRDSKLGAWIRGTVRDEEKWPRMLGRHLQLGDADAAPRTESSEEIPLGGRFKVDKLDDLLCLPIPRAVLVLCRGERKSDSRDELWEAEDSPDNDMAEARVGRKRKLRKVDGLFRIWVGNDCGDPLKTGEAGGDMC